MINRRGEEILITFFENTPSKMWYNSPTVNISLNQNRANLTNFPHILLVFYYHLWYRKKKSCWENMKVTNFPWRNSSLLHLAKSILTGICAVTETAFWKALEACRILYPLESTAALCFWAEWRQHKGYLRTLPVAMLLMANVPGQRPKISYARHRINMGGKITAGTSTWARAGLGCPRWSPHRPPGVLGKDDGSDLGCRLEKEAEELCGRKNTQRW